MMISRQVTECDVTGAKYTSPVDGAAHLCRGQTGRWCEVLHVGPEQLALDVKSGAQVLTPDAARAQILAMPGCNTVDF